ncbi:hypothetical protein JCM8202_001717 [Rhodotorula sphaerocarpa]
MATELHAAPELVSELPPLPQRRKAAQKLASPLVQVVIISLICFCSPGVFNALSGMGGGGQLDPTAANNANIALYCTFAVFGVAAGGIVNRIGYRLSFALGAAGYTLYIGSLLSYNINGNGAFVIASGAILGLCAALLWTSQGSLTLAYAAPALKGRYFGVFWALFNLGGVIGAAVELGLTWDSTTNTVGNPVYIALLAIAACGSFLPLLLANPATIVRSDGSRVVPPVHPTWRKELIGMWELLKSEKLLIALAPLAASSNWTYTYEQSTYNGHLFTLRTRALNSLLFWLFQMVGAGIFGVLIDLKRFSRVARAWSSFAFLLALHMAVWGATYHVQKGFHRDDEFVRIDLDEGRYAGYGALYVFQGILDAVTQNWAYWLMGAITSNPAQLARLVGFYKGIQSAGAAGAFAMDSGGTSYMHELAATWVVAVAGLVCAVPVLAFRLKKGTEEEQAVEAETGAGKHETASLSSAEEKKADEAAAMA